MIIEKDVIKYTSVIQIEGEDGEYLLGKGDHIEIVHDGNDFGVVINFPYGEDKIKIINAVNEWVRDALSEYEALKSD